jgi:hypothetical protein
MQRWHLVSMSQPCQLLWGCCGVRLQVWRSDLARLAVFLHVAAGWFAVYELV